MSLSGDSAAGMAREGRFRGDSGALARRMGVCLARRAVARCGPFMPFSALEIENQRAVHESAHNAGMETLAGGVGCFFLARLGRAVLLCNQKRGRGQTAARKTNGGRKMETMKSEMIREAGDRGWKSLVRARNLKSGNHYRYYLRLGPRGGWKFSRATLPGWMKWAENYSE